MTWPETVISDRSGLKPPADPRDIQRVAERMGVRFPRDYIDFLRFADGGVLPGGTMIVYSVGSGVHPSETLLAANQSRLENFPLVLIARDAYEEYGFLKSELAELSVKDRKCGVYRYWHETEHIELIALSFSEFVEWAIRRPSHQE
jgi:hypothetical protein